MQVKEFKLERPGGLRLHTLPFATGRRVLGTAAMLPPAEKLDTLLLSGSSIELLKTCPKVLKGSGTAKRGDIWISQIGTGKIVATASLVGVRRWASLPDSLHTTLRERLQEVGYTSPHVWDMEGVTLLPEPWHIPPAMRKGCQHWIPKERWNAHAQSSRKRTVPSGKAWPKKFPRKSKTQSEGSCLQQSNEFWKKHARPRPGQRKKKKHRNAVQRLQAGRTAERLDHLATMSLFHERQAFDANPLPRPGRCARWKGNLVYIVACFARQSATSRYSPFGACRDKWLLDCHSHASAYLSAERVERSRLQSRAAAAQKPQKRTATFPRTRHGKQQPMPLGSSCPSAVANIHGKHHVRRFTGMARDDRQNSAANSQTPHRLGHRWTLASRRCTLSSLTRVLFTFLGSKSSLCCAHIYIYIYIYICI